MNFSAMLIIYAVQAITYYEAIGHGANASQVAPIIKSEIVLTVFLATIILKETDNLSRKIVSAILVTIGVFLLTMIFPIGISMLYT